MATAFGWAFSSLKRPAKDASRRVFSTSTAPGKRRAARLDALPPPSTLSEQLLTSL
jgi:hypothetical protein